MLSTRLHLWLLLLLLDTWVILTSLASTQIDVLGTDKAENGYNAKAEEAEELVVDRRPPPTDEQRRAFIAQELPSLPIDFYEERWHGELRFNESCAPYPEILQLQFHNNYWQMHRSHNLTFYLYGAYYDNRPRVQSWEGVVLVRILAMVNAFNFKSVDYPPSYCQLWFTEQSAPVIVPVREYRDNWYANWGQGPEYYNPIFVECAMPQEVRDLVPHTVSLVSSECARATNNLRVIYDPPPEGNRTQRGFAVCSTALYNPYRENSVRLVEWLELLRILGADHVMLPTFGLHPNATKVLRYYEREGFVSAPGISLVRGEPALPHFTYAAIKMSLTNHRTNEIIPLNDCLYRNMYKHEYIVVLDIDEVIMPLGEHHSWADLVRYAKAHIRYDDCEGLTSLCFRNVYFPAYPKRKPYSDEVPTYMYMMQHVARVAEHLEPFMATKCFHDANSVTGLHNHYSMHWTGGCGMQTVNETAGQMQHYREPDIPETLDNPVIDAAIWRYREPLVRRTKAVLRKLGLLQRVRAIPEKDVIAKQEDAGEGVVERETNEKDEVGDKKLKPRAAKKIYTAKEEVAQEVAMEEEATEEKVPKGDTIGKNLNEKTEF
ncbi:PREDICTED: uncharacterized protein LOC108363849 [Rhagoletis zephyria]|uniref:uncharacterized protein LOC108363849 n=1 Tax=Rhagoletis zephyria TaxID=28612 RepID=UPI0008117D46|nr:PREDICTED: uncharacterized protein LOC108363849 [Rhagoletis zephyria]